MKHIFFTTIKISICSLVSLATSVSAEGRILIAGNVKIDGVSAAGSTIIIGSTGVTVGNDGSYAMAVDSPGEVNIKLMDKNGSISYHDGFEQRTSVSTEPYQKKDFNFSPFGSSATRKVTAATTQPDVY